MTLAAIGLGANLRDPAGTIELALQGLAGLDQTRLLARSRLYRSAPIGPAGQGEYCNAAALIETGLTAPALLAALQALEQASGRQPSPVRWAARQLDLDLLFHGNCQMQTPSLTLPHPHLHLRNFVLTPLAEIASGVSIPGLGVVADLAAGLPQDGLQLW